MDNYCFDYVHLQAFVIEKLPFSLLQVAGLSASSEQSSAQLQRLHREKTELAETMRSKEREALMAEAAKVRMHGGLTCCHYLE